MARGGCGANAQLMAAEWNKLVSTEATLTRLVTVDVMAEASIGGWRISPGENYLDPRPGEIVVFKDFYWHGFENPYIPLCANFEIIIKLASAISTPTSFLLCPSSLPSANHILASSLTSICGGTFSASRRKGMREDPR
jgi:hypothetical protein